MEEKVKEPVEKTTEITAPPAEEPSPAEKAPKNKRRHAPVIIDAEHDPELHIKLEPKATPYESRWHYPGG